MRFDLHHWNAIPGPGGKIFPDCLMEAVAACHAGIGLIGRRATHGLLSNLAAIADFALHVATIGVERTNPTAPSGCDDPRIAETVGLHGESWLCPGRPAPGRRLADARTCARGKVAR
ncbi:hypothetical protein predicted by Glimmer/Critica (plasmid) [Sinorhizobium fredii HH103]|uniref:Uncharacterized protein n=1 Tax=Sinorhizobium fredii (strain HH103) TaxID=1117943 RepID=G9AJA4_SINF1|nr:hypothetical protein predicted by Glimmer/Critica [Sinorhizobium fredii HH103]